MSMVRENTNLDDVAAVIGFTATLRLVAWYGDRNSQMYVPLTAGDDHTLAKLIGMPALRRLVDEWPGEYLAIPTMDAYEEDCRNRLVKMLLEKGLSPREIAAVVNLSERRIQQIRVQLEQAGLMALIFGKNAGEKG